MKKIFICISLLIVIQLSIICEDLYFKVLNDTNLYLAGKDVFKLDNIIGKVKKDEKVRFGDNILIEENDHGDGTSIIMGYYYYNERYKIAANDLVPWDTERQFNHIFISDLNSKNRKTWVPDYFMEVLKEGRQELLEYEHYWADPYNPSFYAGEGELREWYEVFDTDTPFYSFYFSHSALSFYYIPFAIKNIKKISNGYTVTVKFGKKNWQDYKWDTYDWSLVENKEFFDLTFIVDGDYMEMYLEREKEPFITFISVDVEFLDQFASIIEHDEADITKVVFPRRGYKVALIGESYKTIDNLRIRNKAGVEGSIISTIPKRSEVKILEVGKKEIIDDIEANWVKVKLKDGKEGWCFGGYLETLPE